MHKINLYKIETEELIKQIDMADAKTRQKEDELQLMQAEYDRKLQLQEKQIEFRRAKQDGREVYELRREHHVQMEEIKQRMTEIEGDLDYYKTKTEKLEAENG
jgi:multidrug resistance efflux pump